MKYWIGVNIRSSSQGLLNALENALPNRMDSRLWDTEQYVAHRGLDLDGTGIICASLFFNDFNERANFKAALGAINGFLHTALLGSFVKMSKCWHDELLSNGTPIKSDELEYEEVIT